ncbi:MAG: cytochrome c biogenesis protein CcdA, partial [Planctomycetota bacterium]
GAADWAGAGRSAMTTPSTYDLSELQRVRSQAATTEEGDGSLAYYLTLAFFGGLLLNVMPCVLPVIGLKVMSFVQQAGESRARAWSLNMWYAIGIVSVFLVLAALAVTLSLGWGDQFGSAAFNIVILAIVFAMSLSLLGVWEIPIPGFVGSGAAMDWALREGPLGALLKGELTTVLATPCTGPLMATAVAWTVSQSPSTTVSVFAVMGLGMASPYLLIGVFPQLIRFIPKPGPWMETFKKAMGLILLATVVWLLTFLDPPLVVPTVALMVSIVAACWWISQTPITDPLPRQAYAWTVSGLFLAVSALAIYGWFYRDVMNERFERRLDRYAQEALAKERLAIANELDRVRDPQQLIAFAEDLVRRGASPDQPWQPFSLEGLGQLTLEDERTVLVDFTADWCATCKTLERFVLKTNEVESALRDAGVVTMEADYTKKPAWMKQTIRALEGNGVPLIAIFPADRPYDPIVFRGTYTKAAILKGIADATGAPTAATAALGVANPPR